MRFDPATYSSYLTFHNSMFMSSVLSDPSYTPLTAAFLGSDQQVIPFQVGLLPPYTRTTGTALANAPWYLTGSPAAAAYAGVTMVAAGTSGQGDVPQYTKYVESQKKTSDLLQKLQTQMQELAPLRMLINPTGFNVSSSKVISEGNWGRNGPSPLIEYWGENQDTIQGQGRIAGFYELSDGLAKGLTRANRQFTASYQNFLSLYLIYRNNGTIWTTDTADPLQGTSKENNLALVGSVYIYYDHTLYIGSFNSFQVTEEAEAPYTLSYSFEFVVRHTVQQPAPTQDTGFPVIEGYRADFSE